MRQRQFFVGIPDAAMLRLKTLADKYDVSIATLVRYATDKFIEHGVATGFFVPATGPVNGHDQDGNHDLSKE